MIIVAKIIIYETYLSGTYDKTFQLKQMNGVGNYLPKFEQIFH